MKKGLQKHSTGVIDIIKNQNESHWIQIINDCSNFSSGDVLEVARLAGIMASKKTADLIPLCHPVRLDSVDMSFRFADEHIVEIEATVVGHDRTGVEMEALTAVSVAALTIYDMCKAVDKAITIGPIELIEKQGGKSGHYFRPARETKT